MNQSEKSKEFLRNEQIRRKAIRDRSAIYYRTNKDKIKKSQRNKRIELAKKQCEELNLPSFLSTNIAFHEKKIVLSFETKLELLEFFEEVIEKHSGTLNAMQLEIQIEKGE